MLGDICWVKWLVWYAVWICMDMLWYVGMVCRVCWAINRRCCFAELYSMKGFSTEIYVQAYFDPPNLCYPANLHFENSLVMAINSEV